MSTKAETINLNFSAATKQANQLDAIAENMERALQLLGGELDTLSACWKGTASDNYRRQGSDVKELLRKNITNVREIASGIRKTADIYREMENQKLEAEK